MSRMAPTTSRSVSVVPRSGSTRTSAAKRRTRNPSGRASSDRVRGGLCRDRYAAVQTTTASFASSDGWKTSGPTSIQRETRDDHEQRNADDCVSDLPPDEAERIGVAERGGSRGRAVHHHEPEEDERRRDEHEQVPLELVALRSHDSRSTSR